MIVQRRLLDGLGNKCVSVHRRGCKNSLSCVEEITFHLNKCLFSDKTPYNSDSTYSMFFFFFLHLLSKTTKGKQKDCTAFVAAKPAQVRQTE